MDHFAVVRVVRNLDEDVRIFKEKKGKTPLVKDLAKIVGTTMGFNQLEITGFEKEEPSSYELTMKIAIDPYRSGYRQPDAKDLFACMVDLDKELNRLREKIGFLEITIESLHSGDLEFSLQDLIDEVEGLDAKNGVGLDKLTSEDVIALTVFQHGDVAVLKTTFNSFAVVQVNEDGTCKPVPGAGDFEHLRDARALALDMSTDETIHSFGM